VGLSAYAGSRVAMAIHWAVLALCLALIVAARMLWPEPVEPKPFTYRSVSDKAFLKLRTNAQRFAEPRSREGCEVAEAAAVAAEPAAVPGTVPSGRAGTYRDGSAAVGMGGYCAGGCTEWWMRVGRTALRQCPLSARSGRSPQARTKKPSLRAGNRT